MEQGRRLTIPKVSHASMWVDFANLKVYVYDRDGNHVG